MSDFCDGEDPFLGLGNDSETQDKKIGLRCAAHRCVSVCVRALEHKLWSRKPPHQVSSLEQGAPLTMEQAKTKELLSLRAS